MRRISVVSEENYMTVFIEKNIQLPENSQFFRFIWEKNYIRLQETENNMNVIFLSR